MFSFGAPAHVTDGTDVVLLKATLVVQDGDAVLLHHEGQRRLLSAVRITVIISVLHTQTSASVSATETESVRPADAMLT